MRNPDLNAALSAIGKSVAKELNILLVVVGYSILIGASGVFGVLCGLQLWAALT